MQYTDGTMKFKIINNKSGRGGYPPRELFWHFPVHLTLTDTR